MLECLLQDRMYGLKRGIILVHAGRDGLTEFTDRALYLD